MGQVKAFRMTVLLTADDKRRLAELSEVLACPKAEIVRAGITTRWMMELGGVPMCADARRCLAPQLHTPRPRELQAPAATEPLVLHGEEKK